MCPANQTTDIEVYQLKVTLKNIKPPIWRRFQITGDKSLYRLHQTLQVVMGWAGYHLHLFLIDRSEYGEPDPDYPSNTIPEQRVKIGEVLDREKMRFTYVYDFGDNWEHQLVVEKILPPVPGMRYPVCLAGKRHSPPEDVGGSWGYEDFLQAISDPESEEHEEYLEWAGGRFDPEVFNLEAVNEKLSRLTWAVKVPADGSDGKSSAGEDVAKEPVSKSQGERVPKTLRPVFDEIVALIDAFCQKHLNQEYAEVSRDLAATLARKRPSPLLGGGKPEVWAGAIVYVVGSVNLLFDKKQTPHMSAGELCEGFGVGKSACSNKAGAIRALLRTYQFDPRWTLPSRMDRNPLVWLIEIDGLLVDARHLPRPMQEEAVRRRLIPYVPGTRSSE